MGRDFYAIGKPLYCSDISIHSPHMGRDQRHKQVARLPAISIHSPRMGRDAIDQDQVGIHPAISIHSPRMGRDIIERNGVYVMTDFNPLSPHGERPVGIIIHGR